MYHLCLEPNGFGSNTLYISIGFFGAMGAYFVAMVGDLAWMICTALMGSYFATTALVELVVVPYVPDGYNYAAFLAYRPSPNMSGLHKDVHNFAMSKCLGAPRRDAAPHARRPASSARMPQPVMQKRNAGDAQQAVVGAACPPLRSTLHRNAPRRAPTNGFCACGEPDHGRSSLR